jgi:hypothetical protein
MRWLLLVVLMMASLAAHADDAFRDDFNQVSAWHPRPDWLPVPATNPVLRSEDGLGKFEVAEPGRGMKWERNLDEDADLELSPWLVIRYRAVNYDPGADYLLYVRDGDRSREGIKLIVGDRIRADGQWHTQAFELPRCGVVSPVSALGLQCLATPAGDAALWVDYLAITDLPPTDAEGYAPPLAPAKEWKVDLGKPADWAAQPSWLGNYTPKNRCEAAARGLVFRVAEGSMGAKWSHGLPEPITGAQWAAMRYRARNLRSWGDYVLYAAISGGGQALQEQNVIKQGELTADGEWHVAVARITVPAIKTLAIQVQAEQDGASLEVADLRFLDQKPAIKLSDTFDGVAGWPREMKGWRTVSLPPGSLSGEDLSRRLGVQGWIPAGKLTASGIPFQVRSGANAVNMTPLQQPGEVAVSLSGKASEAYLLLAAQFPQNDEPSYSGTSGLVRHVNRLVARLEYGDGTHEEQFPLAVTSRQHAVARGLHTYALALDPTRSLKQLSLVDGMSRGAFGLVALTLSDRPGPATAATKLQPALRLPAPKPIEARATGIKHTGNVLTVAAGTVSMTLDLSKGLRVASLANHSGQGLTAGLTPGPLFRVIGEGFELTSEQFSVDDVTTEQVDGRPATRVDLSCDQARPPISVSVWVDVADPKEIGLRASLDLRGHDPAKTQFIFPELRDLRFGQRAADTWIWTPRRGDVLTAAGVNLREPYAGAGNPFQVIGAFDPRQGTGLYLMTQDMDALSKFYHVQKTAGGTRLAVEYNPLHDTQLPRTVIGCNQGDWHAQLARYREWLATWYRPAAPRKPWFREVWNFRQQFLHFTVPTASGMFDPATKTFKLKEVVDADAAAFGGVDYLHLFDWGWDPVHGRCGDYEPWDYLGGADNFHRAVEEVKAADIPVGLYLEGILVDQESNLGKAHGAQWQMLDPAGKPYTYFAPSYCICPRVPEWQTYLSDTYRRAREQTGAVGFYIDEYGFSAPTYWCYNPAHGHPVPVTPVVGERQMLRQVREKLGPEAAIYTEESPTDVNSQYQDGSFTYNITSVPDEWSPTHVNLYRFALPDFKTIEIICCDQPLGTNVEAVKRILFNGEAIWIEGIRDKWFAPETRAQIALNRRVLRESRQCFTSDHVQPLVPTLLSGLYANQFGERKDLLGKTCWTIYNTNYRTVRAEVIAVDHAPGAQYLDEMTGQPLTPRIVGKKAYLTLDIAPRDVVVVSRGLYVR